MDDLHCKWDCVPAWDGRGSGSTLGWCCHPCTIKHNICRQTVEAGQKPAFLFYKKWLQSGFMCVIMNP